MNNENHKNIKHRGYIYYYEYTTARDRVSICLSTKDPKEYCNGYHLFSTKDPGNGKAFVVIATDNPELKDREGITYLKENS